MTLKPAVLEKGLKQFHPMGFLEAMRQIMKDKGTLINWNARRGFGFIKCELYEDDIFIHISALQNAARAPRVGDTIYFDRMLDDSGKQRAEYASIKGIGSKPIAEFDNEQDYQTADTVSVNQNSNKPSVILVLLGLIAVLYLFQTFSPSPLSIPMPESLQKWLSKKDAPKAHSVIKFSCQGKRYCSQMVSCAEAKFYLSNCPNVKIDGNNDGVPCEKQWCR